MRMTLKTLTVLNSGSLSTSTPVYILIEAEISPKPECRREGGFQLYPSVLTL